MKKIRRVVDTQFWTDDKVVDNFTPDDKLFFLYLLTNPHTSQLGIYKINIKNIAFEIGYSTEKVEQLIEKFQNNYNIIKYSEETHEIAIRNYLKYSIVKGGKPVEDCLKRDINDIKDMSLLKYVYDSLSNCPHLNETVKKIMSLLNDNDKNKDNNNDNYNDNDKDKDNDNENDNDNEESCHDSSTNRSFGLSENDVSKLNDTEFKSLFIKY